MTSPATGAAVPAILYHYFDRSNGPFSNLSDLPIDEVSRVRQRVLSDARFFASRRDPEYLDVRTDLESRLRAAFVDRGGTPTRSRPHYLTLGSCDWLLSWYPDPEFVTIDLDEVPSEFVSFTYGDLFPAWRWDNESNRTRGQLYLKAELSALLARHGLPQTRNPDGGRGPLRYVEAQLWSDDFIPASRPVTPNESHP